MAEAVKLCSRVRKRTSAAPDGATLLFDDVGEKVPTAQPKSVAYKRVSAAPDGNQSSCACRPRYLKSATSSGTAWLLVAGESELPRSSFMRGYKRVLTVLGVSGQAVLASPQTNWCRTGWRGTGAVGRGGEGTYRAAQVCGVQARFCHTQQNRPNCTRKSATTSSRPNQMHRPKPNRPAPQTANHRHGGKTDNKKTPIPRVFAKNRCKWD